MSEEMTTQQLEAMADQLLAEDSKDSKDTAKKKGKLDDKTIASLPAADLLMNNEKLKDLFVKGKKKGKK